VMTSAVRLSRPFESPAALKSPATTNLQKSSAASRSNKSDNCSVKADVTVPIDADDDERRRTMTDDPQSERLELAVVADVDRCCPEGVAVDDSKTATTALGRRCAVTVDDL